MGTSWRKLTKVDGLASPRFHDLRHHAISELVESQISDQTIRAIASLVSQKMLARHSHVRSEARAGGKHGEERQNQQVTTHVVSQTTQRWTSAGSGWKDGRHEETRTPDLYRVKVAL